MSDYPGDTHPSIIRRRTVKELEQWKARATKAEARVGEPESPWWSRWLYRRQRRSLRDTFADQMNMSFPPLDCLRCPEWDEEE